MDRLHELEQLSDPTMTPSAFFPMFAAEKLAECREFYKSLGFECVHDGWYVHLVWPGNPALQIGFTEPGNENLAPVYRTRFSGGGVFLGIMVDDLDGVYRELTGKGFELTLDIREEPWGQRHFGIADPNGVPIDISARKGPEEGSA